MFKILNINHFYAKKKQNYVFNKNAALHNAFSVGKFII